MDRRRAGADDGHRLAGQVEGVVPARGVHRDAREAIDAIDVGQIRHGQRAGGVDEESGRKRVTRVQINSPAIGFVVECRCRHLGVEPNLAAQPVLVDTVFGVSLELAAGSVGARPVRALLERELV
jgi:hypothetical protein